MKRLWAGLLAAGLLLSLAACGGGEEDVETAWTPLQMARAILASQEAPPGMTELLPGDGTYEIYVADSYGLNPEDVADGAILAAGGASAQEIAVLRAIPYFSPGTLDPGDADLIVPFRWLLEKHKRLYEKIEADVKAGNSENLRKLLTLYRENENALLQEGTLPQILAAGLPEAEPLFQKHVLARPPYPLLKERTQRPWKNRAFS